MQRTGKHTASERSAELQIYLTLTQSTQQMVQSCKGNDLPNFFKYFLIAAKCVFQYRALRSCEIYPRLLRASFPHMTPTPLFAVTLARGRQVWPGAALRPPGLLPEAQRGPRYPRPRPGRPRASRLHVRLLLGGTEVARAQGQWVIAGTHCSTSLATQAPCFVLFVLLFSS